jgi:hypothetical protein
MGEEPERRRRRLRPSSSAATPPAAPADPSPGTPEPAVTTARGPVAETAEVLDPEPATPTPEPAPVEAAATDRGPVPGEAAGASPRPAARPVRTAPPPVRTAPPPARTGPPSARPGRPAARPTSGAGAVGDDQSERGLRGLVGSGSSQVSVGAALRARDAARPTAEQLAAAEAELVIVRRNWMPREDLPRNR